MYKRARRFFFDRSKGNESTGESRRPFRLRVSLPQLPQWDIQRAGTIAHCIALLYGGARCQRCPRCRRSTVRYTFATAAAAAAAASCTELI